METQPQLNRKRQPFLPNDRSKELESMVKEDFIDDPFLQVSRRLTPSSIRAEA